MAPGSSKNTEIVDIWHALDVSMVALCVVLVSNALAFRSDKSPRTWQLSDPLGCPAVPPHSAHSLR